MKHLGLMVRLIALVTCMAVSQWSWAVGEVEEDPSALAMTTDALIVRPIMIVGTVVGGALWVVSSPFSGPSGNAKQAADTLFFGPARSAFTRCLGCVGDGYKRGNLAE